MPTYEYTCKSCGASIEAYQSFSDKPLSKHDECGGELQKIFHPRGVVFKGSGFYANDSKKKPSKTAASNGSASAKKDKKEKTAKSSRSSSD